MNKKKDTYVEANLKSEYLHHYEENMKISYGLLETGPGQKLRSFNKATLEISSLHKGKKSTGKDTIKPTIYVFFF